MPKARFVVTPTTGPTSSTEGVYIGRDEVDEPLLFPHFDRGWQRVAAGTGSPLCLVYFASAQESPSLVHRLPAQFLESAKAQTEALVSALRRVVDPETARRSLHVSAQGDLGTEELGRYFWGTAEDVLAPALETRPSAVMAARVDEITATTDLPEDQPVTFDDEFD